MPADGEGYDRYIAELETVVPLIQKWLLHAPPEVGAGIRGLPKLLSLGRDMAGLSTDEMRIVHEYATKSAGDILDRHFKGDLAKALFGFDGVVGNFASPYTPGTAYVLLHHLFGEAAGVPGAWGHAIGGMGSITQAMARACREAGVDILLNTPVEEVIVEKGRAAGVVAGGKAWRAPNDRRRGQSQAAVRPAGAQGRGRRRQVERHMANWECESATFRMNVALVRSCPRFTVLPNKGNHLTAGHHHGAEPRLHGPRLRRRGARRLVAAADHRDADPLDARPDPRAQGQACRVPVLPAFPLRPRPGPELGQGAREGGRHGHRHGRCHAPGFAKSVLGRQIHSPLDLERRFGLIGGDIFHGKMGLDQLFSARPMIGAADYRMPLKGLYLCGSGAHPGGGVTGAPGHNAARAVLADRRPWRRRRLNRRSQGSGSSTSAGCSPGRGARNCSPTSAPT